ncbi:hypothetical protein ACFU7Y_37985 [Kitasatospora sp. NPDC057542]|uniref:hypothetical protein n=1 Tax=Streptomycetaceae TaxID=2062 RepID=UPI001CCB9A61|nr:hypothetical protein [Streptomyces sp. LS1784]
MAERPRRRRVLPIAIGAAVVVAGGGLWYWNRSAPPADVPQSACWNAFTHDDLAALTGRGNGASVRQTKVSFGDLDIRSLAPSCTVTRKRGGTSEVLADISTSRRDEKFRQAKTKAEAAGWQPVVPASLDFGPAAQGWLFHEGTVQLLLHCEYVEADGRPTSFPYRLITITGSRGSTDTPATEVHRIRMDAALRTAKEAVRAQGCTNAPQLAAQAPAAPF